MNCRKSLLLALTLAAATAFAQTAPQSSSSQSAAPAASAPAAQTGNGTTGTMPQTGAPAATSASNKISGCLQPGFAHYQLSDATSNTKYEVRGNGAKLADYENKVVTIQGLPDPKASANGETVFYVQKVEDSGQSCAPSGQAVAGNMPVTGKNGNQGVVVNETTANAGSTTATGTAANGTATPEQGQTSSAIASNQSGQAGAPATPNDAGQSPAAASTNADAAKRAEIGGSSGTLGVDNKMPANGQSTASGSTTSGQEAGGMENKGTPQAGTPAPSASATASQPAGKTFQGCVSGAVNNLMLNANGKSYRIQGSTSQINQLVGHQVEVTGDEVNGKAIDVKSVRDMGGSCSAK